MSLCTCEINPTFQPAMRIITAITNSYPAVITTMVNHLYVTGTIVRIVIPQACGMQQLNNFLGTLTSTGLDTFTLDIDTTYFDAFAVPVDNWTDPVNGISIHIDTCAQVLPVGEDPFMITAAMRNTLPH
jgi:hypothetical protein